MVCHDGSQASLDALSTIKKGLMRSQDELIVGHIWSRVKEEYLDFKLKRDHIKN